jgi:DNA primase
MESWKELSGERLNLSEFDAMFEDDIIETPREKIIKMPESFKTLTSTHLDKYGKKALSYLYHRGISRRDILKWKMGYCTKGKYKNRIVIPSFNENGDLNYFVARSYTDGYIRYMNPPASRDIIFNELYVDFDKEVTLVEGLFDAVKTENSVPILGSSIREDSKLFKKIVKKDTPILLALDPDAKGKSSFIKKLLLKYGIEVREVEYIDERDFGEMSKEEVREMSIRAPFVGDYDNLLSAINAI